MKEEELMHEEEVLEEVENCITVDVVGSLQDNSCINISELMSAATEWTWAATEH